MKIKIKVKNRRWWIPNKTYEIELPQSWAELTQEQLLGVMKVIMRRGDNPSACVPNLILIFGKLPQTVALNLTAQQYVEYFHDRVMWVFSQPLVHPFIPVIHYKHESFLMPSGKLSNLTIEEYIAAEKHFLQFLETKEEKHLDLLIAVLCRELIHNQKVLKKGIRAPYTEESVKIRAHYLKDLPIEQKYYVLYFFIGCRDYIAKNWFDWGKSTSSKKSTQEKHNWEDTLFWIAEKGIFGNYNQVKKTKAHTLFHFLNKEKEKNAPSKISSIVEKIHQKHITQ